MKIALILPTLACVTFATYGCKQQAAPVAPKPVTKKMDEKLAVPVPPSQPKSQDHDAQRPPTSSVEQQGALWAGPELGSDAKPGETREQSSEQTPTRYSWKEIEDSLANLREKSKDDRSARQSLFGWYDRLVSPEFTESKDLGKHLEKLKLWQEELPESSTPLVVMAGAYINYAWEARGIGLAHEVTEESWRLFKERIAEAHELLDQAIERGVKDGQAYAYRIIVAKAEGTSVDEARDLLAQGYKLDPTCMPMYVHMSDYLLPKWHGEPGDVADFAKEAVEMLPGDDGLEALARIIANCHCSDRTILYWGGIEPKTWRDASKVFFERFPNSSVALNYAGLMAMAGGDYELGQCILDAFEEQEISPDDLAWGPQGFKTFQQWCRAPLHPNDELYRLRGSLGPVRTVAFSEDPRFVWIATSEAFTPILLVDTHTGEGRIPLRAPGLGVWKLEFDSKQSLLVAPVIAGGMSGAIVYKMNEPDQPLAIPLRSKCNCVSISPVAPFIAAHDGASVQLIDVEQRKINHTLELPDTFVNRLVFSADGKLLATYARAEVSVWEVETGKKRYSIPTHDAMPRPEVAIGKPFLFDSDNRLLAEYWMTGGKMGLGRFTEGETEPEILLPDVQGGFSTVSPDGKYFATDVSELPGQRKVSVWDMKSKSVVKVLEGHALSLSTICFSPDSRLLATGSRDGELKIWEVEPADEQE